MMAAFSAELRNVLREKYGRVPSASFIAIHFSRHSNEISVSHETARRWLRGISMPSYTQLRVLILWLNLDIRRCFDIEGARYTGAGLQPEISQSGNTTKLVEHLARLPIETQQLMIELLSCPSCRKKFSQAK
jgi:hypothetical protein